MHLGRDEQQPAAPFIRVFSKTDIQELTGRMIDLIPEYHGGIDWLNPKLYARLGFFELSENNPVLVFLQRLILEMKKKKKPLTEKTAEMYKTLLVNKYDYSQGAIDDYIRAYIELDTAGDVPESISHPWEYEPSSFTSDIGKTLFSRAGLFVLGAVAVYGISTTIIPQTGEAFARK